MAGKAPHTHGIFVGGTTTHMDIEKYQEGKSILNNIKNFIKNFLIEDIYIISQYYKDYFDNGKGHGNLMSTELFYNNNIPLKYVGGGVIINGKKEEFNVKNIVEEYKYTRLEGESESITPFDSPPQIKEDKEGAYSWVVAPRYKNQPMEVGPLSRMIIGGYYENKISTMDRIMARVKEANIICECMESLLEYIRLQMAFQQQFQVPSASNGIGIVEASRGTLIHVLEIENSVVKKYNLLPPSQWNLSPKDNNNINGTVEKALIGTYIENEEIAPTIIGRIVRSFDPCLNCAAHITSDKKSTINVNII